MQVANALESIILQATYYSSSDRNIIVDCWVDTPKTLDFQLNSSVLGKAQPKQEK